MKKTIELINILIRKIERIKELDKKSFSNYHKIQSDLQKILNIILTNHNDAYLPSDDVLYSLLINEFAFMVNNNESDNNEYFDKTSILDLLLMLSGLKKEYGNLMENLFFSDDYIVGIHATTNHNKEVLQSILKNGLINNYRADLTTTVHIFDKNLNSFEQFLLYNHKTMCDENCVVVAIPKKDIESGIWCKREDKYYLNPYYIVGIIIDMHKGPILNKNPPIIYNYNSAFISENYQIPNDQIYNYKDEYLEKFDVSNNVVKR